MSGGRELQTHTDLNSVSLPELTSFFFLSFGFKCPSNVKSSKKTQVKF